MSPGVEQLLDVALEAVRLAGEGALRWFRSGVEAETKADGSPVTAADREAERVLRDRIRAAFPDHAILGEEGGESSGAAPYRWILDPIDGTHSFVRGVPMWGTLLAVEFEGEPVIGVCHLPALGETVAAAHGRGCHWNGRPCRVSEVTDLGQAVLCLKSPRQVRRRAPGYTALEEAVGAVRGWSDCYAYCLVATGRAEISLDPRMDVWDCGPFLTILEEAGGRFTDWQGRRVIDGGDALATNGPIHDAVLSMLGSMPGLGATPPAC